MTEKKPIPDISPKSKLSTNYRKAYGPLSNFIKRVEDDESNRTVFLAKRTLQRSRIPTYEEMFRPEEYANAVNDENREAVEELNGLVAKLNQIRSEISVNTGGRGEEYSALKEIHYKLEILVYEGKTIQQDSDIAQ